MSAQGHQQPSIVSPPDRLECEVKQPFTHLLGELLESAKSGRPEHRESDPEYCAE